jgi:chromosome segregation ATPase
MSQDVIAKLTHWQEEVDKAKREKAQAEGRLQSALKQLQSYGIEEKDAPRALEKLIDEHNEIRDLARQKLAELEEVYEL